MEKQDLLTIGKWYRNINTGDYIQYHHTEEDRVFHTGWVYEGKYELRDGTSWYGYVGEYVEASLEEIQKYLPGDHPDKIKENLEYVKCLTYLEESSRGPFTPGKIYKKKNFSTSSHIQIVTDYGAVVEVSLLGRYLSFEHSTKEAYEQQKLVKKQPVEQYVVGRYFKALTDDAQGSKVKAGEYYQITRSENDSFYFISSHDYSMSLSKSSFIGGIKHYELMPLGWSPEIKLNNVMFYVKVKPGRSRANCNNFKDKKFNHYSEVIKEPVIKVLGKEVYEYGTRYYGYVGEEQVCFITDVCIPSTEEAYNQQFKPKTEVNLTEEPCEDCNGEGVKKELQSKKTSIVYNSVADLVVGEVYTDGDVIFKSIKRECGPGFRKSCDTYHFHNNWNLKIENLKLASFTEIEWLNVCIKQDRYLTFEKACSIPKTSLTSFPETGSCDTLDLRLKEYLVKTRGGTSSNGVWKKGLAWSKYGWWPYANNTGYQSYQLSDLEQFLEPNQTGRRTAVITSTPYNNPCGEIKLPNSEWKEVGTKMLNYIFPSEITIQVGPKKPTFQKMEVLVGKSLEPIKSTFRPIQFKTIKRIK